VIRTWESPVSNAVGASPEEFLRVLDGPCWIRLRGADPSRTRAVTTLVHGNESSGVRALHRFLREHRRAATDVLALVASVHAALQPPGFAHRMLPGTRDLNRCFAGPWSDAAGSLAREILDGLQAARPEALIDLHNTSGAGPSYGVGTRRDPACLALASLFAVEYVLTDIRLGALMEATADEFPAVTIECGGAGSTAADEVAFKGLQGFLCGDVVPESAAAGVAVLEHPVRVCLAPGATLAYSHVPAPGRTLSLRSDLDQFNSTVLAPGELLGWTRHTGILLSAHGSPGGIDLEEAFEVGNGELRARRGLRLFMATTDVRNALSDCLFYVIPA